MIGAKDIRVERIDSRDAARIIRAIHYSGSVVTKSQLHFGVFAGGRCGGAMSFGPPLDKRKSAGLVRGTSWENFCELNRMAFADWLPRNSESRALGVAFRWFRKHAPEVRWIQSFADATQCGDGAIYRASGFELVRIKRNHNLFEVPGFGVVHKMTLTLARPSRVQATMREAAGMPTASPQRVVRALGGRPLPGWQVLYVRFLDPSWRERLTVPVLPFAKLDELGVRMYRGQRIARADSDPVDTLGSQPREGGSTPTSALHSDGEACLDDWLA